MQEFVLFLQLLRNTLYQTDFGDVTMNKINIHVVMSLKSHCFVQNMVQNAIIAI